MSDFTWPLDDREWSRCLLQEAFSRKKHHAPVRAVEASDAFVARAIGVAYDDAREARRRLIDSLKSSHRDIRRLLDSSHQLPRWHDRSAEPPFFGQLYLTLLAATANEDTFDERNFRERWCVLLECESTDLIAASGLPTLWRELSDWLSTSGSPKYRQLILPDYGFERIIGYSKRLAFPKFRDSTRLADTLRASGASSESAITDVVHAIQKTEAQFSDSFREEFASFQRCIARTPELIHREPMWAAIEAADFDARVAQESRGGLIRLELNFDEFGRPIARLLSNKPLSPAARHRLSVVETDPAVDGLAFEIRPSLDCARTRVLPMLFEPSSAVRRYLGPTYLGRQLAQGCVCLAPDRDVEWLSRVSLPPSGPCLILCSTAVRSLLLQLNSVRHISDEPVEGAKGWWTVRYRNAAELLGALRGGLAAQHLDALRVGVAPRRITVSQAVRVPDGILVNSATRPLAHASAATLDLVARYTPDRHDELGELDQECELATWRIAQSQIDRLQLPTFASFVADRGTDAEYSREIRLTSSVPAVKAAPSTSARHLCESPFGQLAAAGAALMDNNESQPNPLVRLPKVQLDASHFESPLPVELDKNRVEDLLDALAGHFFMASSLATGTVLACVDKISRESGIGGFEIVELLFANQILKPTWTRTWSDSILLPIAPSLVHDPSQTTFALVGLSTRSQRRQFEKLCGSRLKVDACDTIRGPRATHFDTVEAEVTSMEMELPLRPANWTPVLKPADILSRRSFRFRAGRTGTEIKWWCETSKRLVPDPPARNALCLSRTRFDRSPALWEIRGDGTTIWCTESRAWALLAYRTFRTGVGCRLSGVNLTAEHALPLAFAQAAIEGGGGIQIGRESGGRLDWVYSFQTGQQAVETVPGWLGGKFLQKSTPALKRWARTLDGTRPPPTKALVNEFERRYVDLTRPSRKKQ
jgi:hypothetical protein